jgi:hypothetical protein
MSSLISIVPSSGLQFWDVALDIERLPNRRHSFWEEKLAQVADASQHVPVQLRPLDEDKETGELTDATTGRVPPEDDVYTIGRGQALEPFLGKWVPLPFFRVRGRLGDGRSDFDRGPTNWARVRLVALPTAEPGRTHHLTLAFDTALVPRDEGDYLGPDVQNAELQHEFGLAAGVADCDFFLNEGWVGEWLSVMLEEVQQARHGGRPARDDSNQHGCEHLARYLVFLDILREAAILPQGGERTCKCGLPPARRLLGPAPCNNIP